MSDESKGIRILVCGSKRFEDYSVISGIMGAFVEFLPPISAVVSGNFGNCDSMVAKWAEEEGIKHEEYRLPASEFSLLDREIPEIVANRDPSIIGGAKKLSSILIDLVVVIPGPDGSLGAAARNIKRMAGLAAIPVIDGDVIFSKVESLINHIRDSEAQIDAILSKDAEPASALPSP